MIYVFGDYELDTRLYELRCAGQPCKLEPQVFDVLAYLMAHRDRVVTKHELLDNLWPNQFISEVTLNHRLMEARKAIGDSGRAQRCIKTLHGRGYRFIAAVQERTSSPSDPADVPVADTTRPCPACQHANAVQARFCNVCATALLLACPSCRHDNPSGATYCQTCAASLSSAVRDSAESAPPTQTAPGMPPLPQPLPAPPLPEAERRQLTVMFCDLVESTALASQLDPEELRDIIQAYQQVCTEVIQTFDGHIAQYLGDGLLVYFGYPQAHEDDAQRAVRAGLGIIAALGQLTVRPELPQHMALAVRVGIHTGLVVVGTIGGSARQEHLALGETPNIAARLQGIAVPNTVVVSSVTCQLVQGYFAYEALGEQTLKGLATPTEAYRIVEAHRTQSHFDVIVTRGLTPLVGRTHEVALLRERWEQVKDGYGQVVLLSGEAGMGKSRLVQELYRALAGEPHIRLACQSSPYYQHTALHPVIDLLEREAGFHREDTPEAKVDKLEHTLRQWALPLPETVPPLAALLSLPLPEHRYPLQQLAPQRQRQQILEMLLNLVLALAAQQPVLFIVEDLHWSDPSTLEWLDLHVKRGPAAPILMLMTCRADFHPPWGIHEYVTHLTVNRLPPNRVAQMVASMLGEKTLPEALLQQVVAKADGIPLFVEEVTKWVVEAGLTTERSAQSEEQTSAPPLAIPPTLQASLMARLDRLGPAKRLAQLSATLGKQFSYELLQAVSTLDEASLQRDLERLVEAALLYQRGAGAQATYTFKHALIQEAAYQSLLKRTRQQYHWQIAQALVERFPDTARQQSELLAYHYTQAQLHEQAIGYWQRAGEHAAQRSAHVEAIAHLTQGLALLTTLPDTPKRAQDELTLLTRLRLSIAATKGYAVPELAQVNSRMRTLCQQVHEPTLLLGALTGMWPFYLARAELQTARELAEQVLALAGSVQRTSILPQGRVSPRRPYLWGHFMLGQTLLYLGELSRALEELDRARAVYDPHQHRPQVTLAEQDPGVTCLAQGAHALWYLGYPEQALQRSQAALALARDLAHPFSLVWALSWAASLHGLRREYRIALEYAESSVALATEQGFAQWGAQGVILRGWARAMLGQHDAGIAQIQQGLAAYQSTGAALFRPLFLTLLAEGYHSAGQATEGLRVLADAMDVVDRTAERFYEAEIYRLQGELLLAQGGTRHTFVEAERYLRKALDTARGQQARSLELRAATSLSRLWWQQGRQDDASRLLREIYGWFTEGFDTADLQEAQTLLEGGNSRSYGR
jgi:class 3 adenylate cyclase/predicted ATPase/DNA-binding winged helix-turn-helix (wHTH) protein